MSAVDDLVELRDTAARVVHARHGGCEAEDLVQEAWARAAVAVRDRPVDDPNAYVAAVAANLVRIHGRREACRQRWAARLFVRPFTEPADAAVVLQEEQAAMAIALQHLPLAARDLLVAHTVHGRDTLALAASTGSTPGAVAAGLARARATLRVEYLLAFRRLPRPDDVCLRTLYAISAADARRQARLGSDDHVASCATCAPLAEALREKRRPSVSSLIALRVGRWMSRLGQIDGPGGLGPRVGVAGGLVGMGVATALVLGGSAATHTGPRSQSRVQAASVDAMRLAGVPRLSANHHKATHGTTPKHSVAGVLPAHPSAPVSPTAEANVSGSGVSVTAGPHHVTAASPSQLNGVPTIVVSSP